MKELWRKESASSKALSVFFSHFYLIEQLLQNLDAWFALSISLKKRFHTFRGGRCLAFSSAKLSYSGLIFLGCHGSCCKT